MTLTQIKPAGLSTPVDLADNAKIRLGTSNDLEIYHDGSNSVITAGGAGDLQLTSTFDDVIIQAADNIFINPQGGEDGLKVYGDGAVKLYYDNSQKLETIAGGVSITGELNVTTKVAYPDNGKAIFGTGDDLQIYHDGTNSYINDAGSGALRIVGSQLLVRNAADDENMIVASQNGAVALYYDNVNKAETDTNGITVTGRVLASGTSNIGFAGLDNVKLSLGTSDDFQIYHDGSSNRIIAGNHDLIVQSNGYAIRSENGSSTFAIIDSSGKVGIGTSPNYELQVNDPSGVVSAIQLTNTTTGTGAGDGFLIYNHGNNALISNEEIGSLKFQTSGIERLVIESDGRLICGAVATADTGTYYDDITINNSNTASGAAGGAGLSIVSGDSSYGGIYSVEAVLMVEVILNTDKLLTN